jgi:hypothetical protein
VVGFEGELTEGAFGAPTPEARHQDRAVEFVLHPPPYRIAIAPHRREEVPPLRRALPDRGLQAALDRTRLLERAFQVSAHLCVATVGAAELGEHKEGLRAGCALFVSRRIGVH